MNKQNYCSLELSQKLVANGIVLETEAAWCDYGNQWGLGYTGLVADDPKNRPYIPAPNLSELWLDLPESNMVSPTLWTHLTMEKTGRHTECYYRPCDSREVHSDINPCDALAELLLWVRKEKV